MFEVKGLKFNENGLIPAIVQEYATGEVLMLAYMNRESLEKTLETGNTWFWSRSRSQLWNKGATSGNIQRVKSIFFDCDGDTLLLEVEQVGNACHTGEKSCFFNNVYATEKADRNTLEKLYNVISHRRINPKEDSYTSYLFEKGLDKILKKVGEEASEVIIAAKNPNPDELINETADLIYHLLVLLKEKEIEVNSVFRELTKRME